MTAKIHYFNPGYEAGIALGDTHYTASVNVQRMRRELAFLPAWYAEVDDYVWVEECVGEEFLFLFSPEMPPLAKGITPQMLCGETALPKLEVEPWGLSPQSSRFFGESRGLCGENRGLLNEVFVAPSWNTKYAELTHRKTAAECLKRIKEQLPEMRLPEVPLFLSSVEEITSYISGQTPPFVLKTPYSSSGRGLLWVYENSLSEKEKDWIKGGIKRQKVVSVERGLNKVKDFALEFHIDKKGVVCYEGISLFETEGKGAYSGNRLAKQEVLTAEITTWIGEDVFCRIKALVSTVLEEVFGGYYSGYLGVDMLVYSEGDDYRIYPCVEINMRRTMGMVAVHLFEHYIDPSATGHFLISYEKDAYQKHQEMSNRYPLKWKNGRLLNGYLPLCPVTPETHYRAYVLIDD